MAVLGLSIASPLLIVFIFLVWRQDGGNPFYIAPRVGKNGRLFSMVKLRSMISGADAKGGASTASTDMRITKVGHYIRRYKLDELTQLWNVLIGDMSLVGPRPQIQRATLFYTAVESNLLSIRPGITDFSSIVFADEGDILKQYSDPDLAYEQLIRPWKSRLSLFYVQKGSILVDVALCSITCVAIVSRRIALNLTYKLMSSLGASTDLLAVCSRKIKLVPTPPPGATKIVTSPDGNLNA